MVPEFQEHPKNDVIVGVISFLETRTNQNGPNQKMNERGRLQPYL